MICNICLTDTDCQKENDLDLCKNCIKLVEKEKANPRICKPID